MKFAPIAPNEHIQDLKSDYFLALPWNVHCYRRKLSSYLILDNGAAEGEQVVGSFLYNLADAFRCDEVVIPDVIGNSADTIERALDWAPSSSFNHMAVAQGESVAEVVACALELLKLPYVSCIGVSKFLRHSVGIDARRQVVEKLLEYRDDINFEIHLLGSGDPPMNELALCADLPVRGCDSALPGLAALQGIELVSVLDMQQPIDRHMSYFHTLMSPEQVDLMRDNADVFARWVSDGT